MISFENLSLSYGDRILYKNVNLTLSMSRRYALVGGNGAGKSTLLKLISGEESPSEGYVTVGNRSTIGWLRQDQFLYEEDTILNAVLRGKPLLWKAMSEKNDLIYKDSFTEEDGYRLGELEEIIMEQDGYVAEAQAEQILEGLGIPLSRQQEPLKNLSGGYKLRVLLAQTLFNNPDVMLLDEPTNHLDITSIVWLEKYLKDTFQGLLVFISHDEDFLNNLATHILDIDYGEIREYVGNFAQFEKQKQEIVDQRLSQRESLEKEIARQQVFIDKFRASPSRSRQALSREKQLEKIELPEIENSMRRSPDFQFQQKRPSGKLALKTEHISKAFGDNKVLKNVSLQLHRGEKVAIIGPNGMGKSTFLKIIMDQLEADSGTVQWGHEAQIGYFAQDHHEALKEKVSVFNWLNNRHPALPETQIRRVLGCGLFTQDEVHKSILTLSGGEAGRLLLCDLMLQQSNVMVLDEPTNHMDLETVDALGQSLKEYEGTILFVSHNRHFVSQVADTIFVITPKGLERFSGSYEDYLIKQGDDYLRR